MKPIWVNDMITNSPFSIECPDELAEKLYKTNYFIHVWIDYERDVWYLDLESPYSGKRVASEFHEIYVVEALYELTSKMEAIR